MTTTAQDLSSNKFSTAYEVELFTLLLVHYGEYTLIPELVRIFGPQGALDFCECFAGVTIEVPKENTVFRAARDAVVFSCMEQAHNKDSEAERLASWLEYSVSEVHEVYEKVKNLERIQWEKDEDKG